MAILSTKVSGGPMSESQRPLPSDVYILGKRLGNTQVQCEEGHVEERTWFWVTVRCQ